MNGPQGERRIATALGIFCLLLAVLNHVHGDRIYMDGLNTDQTLYVPQKEILATPQPVPTPAVRRLVVVVIDGLGDGVADQVPAIAELAQEGVRRTLLADFPSFTYASLATLVTGVPPLLSGVRLNGSGKRVALDSLLSAGRRARVPVRLLPLTWKEFGEGLFGPAGMGLEALSLADLGRDRGRELIFVHIDQVDQAGHRHGAASPKYREAAIGAGEILRQIRGSLDLSQDALIALSDHGHLPDRGHGGNEPEVLRGFLAAAGAGLVRGQRLPPARMVDVCSTVAMLLGFSPPRDNLGAPLVDMVNWDEAHKAAAIAPYLVPHPVHMRLLPHADAHKPPTPLPWEQARAWLVERDRNFASLYEDHLWQRQKKALVWCVPLLLLTLVALLLSFRKGLVRLADHLPLLLYSGAFSGLYSLAGYRLSWSVPRSYALFVVETGLCAAAALVLALVPKWTRRRPRAQALTVVWLYLAYGVCAALSGNDPAWLAGPRASFALLYVATLAFYPAIALGILCLVAAYRKQPE